MMMLRTDEADRPSYPERPLRERGGGGGRGGYLEEVGGVREPLANRSASASPSTGWLGLVQDTLADLPYWQRSLLVLSLSQQRFLAAWNRFQSLDIISSVAFFGKNFSTRIFLQKFLSPNPPNPLRPPRLFCLYFCLSPTFLCVFASKLMIMDRVLFLVLSFGWDMYPSGARFGLGERLLFVVYG